MKYVSGGSAPNAALFEKWRARNGSGALPKRKIEDFRLNRELGSMNLATCCCVYKNAVFSALLIAATPVLAASNEQVAFIDAPVQHRCMHSSQVYLATLERDPEPNWVYSAFGPFAKILQLYHERMRINPLPDVAEIRCDMIQYVPTRD